MNTAACAAFAAPTACCRLLLLDWSAPSDSTTMLCCADPVNRWDAVITPSYSAVPCVVFSEPSFVSRAERFGVSPCTTVGRVANSTMPTLIGWFDGSVVTNFRAAAMADASGAPFMLFDVSRTRTTSTRRPVWDSGVTVAPDTAFPPSVTWTSEALTPRPVIDAVTVTCGNACTSTLRMWTSAVAAPAMVTWWNHVTAVAATSARARDRRGVMIIRHASLGP